MLNFIKYFTDIIEYFTIKNINKKNKVIYIKKKLSWPSPVH